MCIRDRFLKSVLEEVKPVFAACAEEGQEKIIVSIVEGVEVSTYMKELELEGKNVPVIRILPNTACLIGKGFILIEQGDSYTKEQEDEFRYILREAGGFDSLPASQFVAGTVLTSTSPAFIAMFANSLADGGVYNGLLPLSLIHTSLTQMRFASVQAADYYPATSLGGFTTGMTTEEMAGAYAALSDQGQYREPTCIIKMINNQGEDIFEDVYKRQVLQRGIPSARRAERKLAQRERRQRVFQEPREQRTDVAETARCRKMRNGKTARLMEDGSGLSAVHCAEENGQKWRKMRS